MGKKQSAGIFLYRFRDQKPEVLLVHPGGPFWAGKDNAAWSMPKGEFSSDENPLAAALREFQEETGFMPGGPFTELGSIRQAGGKTVHAWAAEGEFDPEALRSNVFELEWPPKSGKRQMFPEVDRASWFSLPVAKRKLHKGQTSFIDRLIEKLGA